jgi:hypothetical protein
MVGPGYDARKLPIVGFFAQRREKVQSRKNLQDLRALDCGVLEPKKPNHAKTESQKS